MMTRPLTALLLALLLAFSGVAPCAARAMSCAAKMQAHRDCCGHGALRGTSHCCCTGERASVGAPQALSELERAQQVAATVSLFVPTQATPIVCGGRTSDRYAGDSPPPDTLVTQHALLLV